MDLKHNRQPEARARFLTWPFALVFAANFLQGLAIHPYLHLPGYLSELGASETMIGVVFGTANGAAICIRPFAGRAMDGVGRKVVILAGSVLHIVVCLLYTTVDSVGPWLFVVRALQGFAIGALFSALFTYAADIVPASRRTQGIALFGVSGMLPMSLGGLLGDWVLSSYSYQTLFLLTAGFSALALLAAFRLPEPDRSRTGGQGFFAAAFQPDLTPVWFVGSAFAVALAGIFAFLKIYTEELLGFGSVGLFFSWYTGAAILLRIFFGGLPERVGAMRIFYPSMLALALALATLSQAQAEVWIAVAGVLAGLGHGFAFPILSAIAVERANPSDRGSAMSLFTAIFDAGFLVGGASFGWLVESAGFRMMFLAAAAIPLLGSAVFFFWDQRAVERKQQTS